MRKIYLAYFKLKLSDQDKPLAPHIVCKACVESLREWANGTLKSFRFGVAMFWRESKNHFKECYFCLVDLEGLDRHRKNLEVTKI